MKNLTKYEFSRILGARALQLSLGAPPVVKLPKGLVDSLEIAKKEFEENAIPLSVMKN